MDVKKEICFICKSYELTRKNQLLMLSDANGSRGRTPALIVSASSLDAKGVVTMASMEVLRDDVRKYVPLTNY